MPLMAAAQSVTGGARVNTYVDSCVPIDIEQFHRVLAIELGTSIEYSPGAAQAPDGALVQVTCGDLGIELRLDDNLTHKSMQRQVELPQLEVSARTRLLALTVAEFVVASWVELHLAKKAALPAAGPPVQPGATAAVKQAVTARLELDAGQPGLSRYATRWQVGLSFDPIVFSRGTDYIPQASLRIEQRSSSNFSFGLVLSLGRANWEVRWEDEPVAKAALTTTSARVNAMYVAPVGPFDLSAGLGLRVGVVHMAGQTLFDTLFANARFFPWAGPVVTLSATVRAGDNLRLFAELEGGYATLAAQATIRDLMNNYTVIAEFGGVWGVLAIGAGWLF